MKNLDHITFNPQVMGEKPCVRDLRVTVRTLLEPVAAGHSTADILEAYSYLEAEDISQALTYAAWRVEEVEVPLNVAA